MLALSYGHLVVSCLTWFFMLPFKFSFSCLLYARPIHLTYQRRSSDAKNSFDLVFLMQDTVSRERELYLYPMTPAPSCSPFIKVVKNSSFPAGAGSSISASATPLVVNFLHIPRFSFCLR